MRDATQLQRLAPHGTEEQSIKQYSESGVNSGVDWAWASVKGSHQLLEVLMELSQSEGVIVRKISI